MFCMNCGEPLSGKVNFCPHCGHKVDWSVYSAMMNANVPQPEKNEDTPAEAPILKPFGFEPVEPETTDSAQGGSAPAPAEPSTGFAPGDGAPAPAEPSTGFVPGDGAPAPAEPSTGFAPGDGAAKATEPSTGFVLGDGAPAPAEPETTGFVLSGSDVSSDSGSASGAGIAAAAGLGAAAAGLTASAGGPSSGSPADTGSQITAGWNPFRPVDPGTATDAAGSVPSRTDYTAGPSRTDYTAGSSRTDYTAGPSRTDYTVGPSRTDYTAGPSYTDYSADPSGSGPSRMDYSAGPAPDKESFGADKGGFSSGNGSGPDDDHVNPLASGPMTLEKAIHIASGFIGFVPLAMVALGFIFSILFGMASWSNTWGIWRAFVAFHQVVMVAVMLVALAAFGGILYLVATKKVRQTQGVNITLGVSILAAIYAVLRVSNTAGFLRFILFAACTVLGIDLLARFMAFGTALAGGFDLKGSLDFLKEKAGLNKDKTRSADTWNDGGAPGAAPNGMNGAAPNGAPGAAPNGMNGPTPNGMNGPTPNGMNGAAAAGMAGAAAAGMAGAAGGGINSPATYQDQPDMGGSYFDGEGVDLFVNILLLSLASAFTCGIAAPWFLCRIYKWRKEHTVIDGKRLTFNGTGGELLGKWIIWEILTVITCGLFGFYVYIALKKWELSHTAYMGAPDTAGMVYPNSFFDGPFSSYLGYSILCGLITSITCGIAFPWAAVPLIKWEMSGSVVEGDRLGYFGNGTDMFGIYIVNTLLTIVTCGIYASWATCRLNRYIYANTHVIGTTY